MKHTLLLSLFVYLLSWIAYTVAEAPHPILWERSFNMNISNPTSNGQIDQSTSYMVTSQDFQGVILDDNLDDPPERIVLDFGASCLSSNTTLQTLQELNGNTIETKLIQYAQKLALVKRGNCTWSEKLSVVNNLALLNNINITGVFIYDNQTYGDAVIITRTLTNGTGSLDVPTYTTPLPAYRSVLNMTDNDLITVNSTSKTVYFIPNVYGETFVSRINAMTNPTDPSVKTFWLMTAYLSAVSWGGDFGSTGYFFTLNTSYIAYIVSFAGVLIFMIIAFRWWTRRQIRSDAAAAAAAAENVQMRPTSRKLDPLPVDLVNKLPIDTYTPELIKNENCAICLEDFKPGKDDVRLLPCGHGFCVLCIDPWLTQKSCLCPICKWDCLPVDLRKERELRKRRNNQFEEPEQEENQDSEPGPSSPRDSQIEMNEEAETPEVATDNKHTHTSEDNVSPKNKLVNEESSTNASSSSEVVILIPEEEEISHNNPASSSSASERNHISIDLSSQDKQDK